MSLIGILVSLPTLWVARGRYVALLLDFLGTHETSVNLYLL